MRRTSFEDMPCSVAQALEVVGEWWSLLILRDAFLGVTRFGQFEARLGIARNVLTARLDALVGHGVLKRVPYQDNPVRHDYKLTAKGRDLWLAMTALREWGDTWAAPDGPPVELVHQDCGEVATVVPHCSSCGEPLDLFHVRAVPGPGAGEPPMVLAAGGALMSDLRLDAGSLEASGAFVRAAGLVLDEVTGTRVVGHIDLTEEHHTPWGIVHGGVYATAIESAASIGASAAVRDRGMVAVGLTNTTHFLRSVTAGRVRVEAEALNQGRTQQLWRVDVHGDGERLLAHGEVRLQNLDPAGG